MGYVYFLVEMLGCFFCLENYCFKRKQKNKTTDRRKSIEIVSLFKLNTFFWLWWLHDRYLSLNEFIIIKIFI